MPFNRQSVAANLSLGRIHAEDMAELAISALEADYDGPAIRRLAGLIQPSGWEVDQVLPMFMLELGIHLLPKDQAAVRVAYDLARRIVDERKNPRDYVTEFSRLWIESGYPREIESLGFMEDDVFLAENEFDQSAQQVRADLHDLLVDFLRTADGIIYQSDYGTIHPQIREPG